MADKQSRLAEIYKAEKSKGGGIASTLGKRALEKMDPRKFFNQKGFLAAALPSLFKSYSATPGVSGRKLSQVSSEIGQARDNRATSFSTGALETKLDSLTGETRELKIHSKIAAKNSESLPIMARDMNLMRQNITKLVKLQGGTAASRADMFFMKSGERESAYENRFIKEGGKSKTPTQVDAKPKEEKKGIFATIMEGLSSIFSMKGLLIAGILAAITFGIKEYFTNDDFKLKVDSFLGDMFTTIKNYFMEKLPVIIDFMRDHWKELALAFALLFPKTTMDLIAGGLNVLSSGITLLSKAMNILIPILEVTLVNAFRGLVTLLSGPAGLIILLGGALFAARKLFDQNQEEYLKLAKEKKEKGSLSEKDEARLKQLETPVNRQKARQDLKYDPTTGKAVSDEEAAKSLEQTNKDTQTSYKRIEDAAFIQLANEWEKGGKKDPLLNPNDRRNVTRRTEELKAQGYVPKDMPADVKVEGSGAPSILPNENETAGGAAVGLVPTSGIRRKPGLNHGGRTTQKLVGGGVDDERLIKPDAPTPASYSNEGKTRPTTAPSSTGAYRGQRSDKAPTPSSSSGQSSNSSLLDIIAGGESGSMGYDAANKGKAGDMPGGYPGLSKMTVNEVMRLQSEGKVFATGRYQIIPTTLAGLMTGAYGNTGVKGGDLYDASTQDKLGTALINKRLKQGGSDPIQQQFALSQEFASIANPYTGSSYYDKVGNNKASIGTQTIQAALTGTGVPPSTVVASANPSTPASSPNFKMPTLGTLAAAAPTMGAMIESATSEFTGALRLFDSALASITNITNNNTQSSAGGQQSQGALPSVYDDVFLSLFQRVT
jgi:hypothetical protein